MLHLVTGFIALYEAAMKEKMMKSANEWQRPVVLDAVFVEVAKC